MKSLYLLIDIFSISMPFLASFHPRIAFYKEWKYYFPAAAMMALFFIGWDAVYTDFKVWGFNPRYILGIRFLGLPIEEILFFVCIPYASIFIYYCLSLYYQPTNTKFTIRGTKVLILCLLAIGFTHIEKAYTGLTSLFTAFFILLLFLFDFTAHLRLFFTSLIIILIPFLIVNGILTGTGIDEEVVWYDNTENLGLRILTIPIEDFCYGFLMLLMPISIWEALRKRATKM